MGKYNIRNFSRRNFTSRGVWLLIGAALILALSLTASAQQSKSSVNYRPDVYAGTPLETYELVTPPARTVDTKEAEKALKGLGLLKPEKKGWQWASRTGTAGNYVFTGLRRTNKNKSQIKIGKLVLSGVHMDGKKPNYDQAVLSDADMDGFQSDDGSSYRIRAGTIYVVAPGADYARGLMNALSGDMAAYEKNVSIPKYNYLSGAKIVITNDKMIGRFNISKALAGQDKNGEGIFSLEGLRTFGGFGDMAVVKLDALDMRGINLDKFKPIYTAFADEIRDEQKKARHKKRRKKKKKSEKNQEITPAQADALIKMFDPYRASYRQFRLKNLVLEDRTVKVNWDTVNAASRPEGGKLHTRVQMTPLVIAFKPSVKPAKPKVVPLADKNSELLSDLGYKSLEFSFGEDVIADPATDIIQVKNAFFQLKDGFRINLEMDTTGWKSGLTHAFRASVKHSGISDDELGRQLLGDFKAFKMHLSLQDRSIVERVFKTVAKQKKTDVAHLKKQASALLIVLPMGVKDKDLQPVAEKAATAVQKFLETGGTLHLELAPELPLSEAKIQILDSDMQALIAFLGLSVRHTP